MCCTENLLCFDTSVFVEEQLDIQSKCFTEERKVWILKILSWFILWTLEIIVRLKSAWQCWTKYFIKGFLYLQPKFQRVFIPPRIKIGVFYTSTQKFLGFLCVAWWHESQVFKISLVYFYVKRSIWSDLLGYNFLGSDKQP